MTSASKDKGSERDGANALDYVKTQQRVGAGLDEKTAIATADKAQPTQAGDPSHDSPKHQGDKLENARDVAAGRGKDR
jgi:hypothetical protein